MNQTIGNIFSLLLISCLALEMKAQDAENYSSLRRAVFKIHVDSQEPQIKRPWKRYSVSRGTGSGFYIGDGRIVTNAHVVAHGKFIAVQRDGDAVKEQAYVEAIAHDCDLAILKVKSAEYFKDTPIMELGDLPKLRSPVVTIGYATGGEQVSITEGIVSRIGFRRYVHSGWHRHLLVQVDSAINPGNSGGPVMQGGKIVGVAFQTNTTAENTGYAIPTPVIKRFLRDLEDGQYDGHPLDGITYLGKATANSGTRKYHGLRDDENGIKVVAVAQVAPAAEKILPGDIITAIDGMAIGSDGKINYRGERVDFSIVYDLKVFGDAVAVSLVRDSKRLTTEFIISPQQKSYRPIELFSNFQPYYVYAGLIFVNLNRSLLKTFGSKWYQKAPTMLRYLHYYHQYVPELEGNEEIIVYVGKLPHAVNAFVDNGIYQAVKSVNGEKVGSLAQLEAAITKAATKYLSIEFLYDAAPIVLDRNWAKNAHAEILSDYRVKPPKSLTGGGDGSLLLKEAL